MGSYIPQQFTAILTTTTDADLATTTDAGPLPVSKIAGRQSHVQCTDGDMQHQHPQSKLGTDTSRASYEQYIHRHFHLIIITFTFTSKHRAGHGR